MTNLHNILIYLFAISIPWQLYLHLYGHVDLPLSFFILCAGLAASILTGADWKTAFQKLKWPVFGYSLMIAAIAVSSLLNSPDNLYGAANVLGRLSAGLMVILWIGSILKTCNRPSLHTDRIIRSFLLSVLPLGIMGIIFLIHPELEGKWLNMIAGVLIEADSVAIESNINAINRIGVVFMDVNTASVFWGMSMWLALWMQEKSRGFKRLIYIILAVIFFLDIIATGSRTGLLALILTLIISYALHTTYHERPGKKLITGTAAIVVIMVLIISLIAQAKPEQNIFNNAVMRASKLFTKDPLSSDKKRLHLLECSIKAIKQKPLLGHGIVDFEKIDFPDGYPPHNLFLLVWIYGGLAAASGLIFLFLNVLYRLFLRLKNNHDMWLPIILISWLIIQSMFLNLIIGDFRIAMLFWLVTSLFLFSRAEPAKNEQQ